MASCRPRTGVVMKKPKLMIYRPEGRLTGDRLGDIFSSRSCFAMKGFDAVDRFHDLRGVTGIEVNFQDIKALARDEAFARRGQPAIKACYLVSNPVVYGLVRMYKALVSECGVDVHVSKDIREIAVELGVAQDQLELKDSSSLENS